MRRKIPTPRAAVTELPFTHHIGDFKTVNNSLLTQATDEHPSCNRNSWNQSQGTRGKEMGGGNKKRFGKFETIYSVVLYKINSFHTTPTIVSKTVPTHTKKNRIVNCSSYTQKELPSPGKCHGSLPSPFHPGSAASCLSKAEVPAWLPISCSAWACLAATLLHTTHSFIIVCKEKISHRTSTT